MKKIRKNSSSERLMKFLYHYGCIMRKDAAILNYIYSKPKRSVNAVSMLNKSGYISIDKYGIYTTISPTLIGIEALYDSQSEYPVREIFEAEYDKKLIPMSALLFGSGAKLFPEDKPSLHEISKHPIYSDDFSDRYNMGDHKSYVKYNLGYNHSVGYNSGALCYSKKELSCLLSEKSDEIIRRSSLVNIVLRGNIIFFCYNGFDRNCKFNRRNEISAINIITKALGRDYTPVCIVLCNKNTIDSIKSILNLYKTVQYPYLKKFKPILNIFSAAYCLPYMQSSVPILQDILCCPVMKGPEYRNILTEWLNSDECSSYLRLYGSYIDNLYLQTVSDCPKTALFLPCPDLVSVYEMLLSGSKYAIFAPMEHKTLYYELMGEYISDFIPINLKGDG